MTIRLLPILTCGLSILLYNANVCQAQAPKSTADAFVEQAALLYGSMEFGGENEDAALRLLTEALTIDPANEPALALVKAIQERRKKQQEQQEQQGQQQLSENQQQEQSAEEQKSESSEDEKIGRASCRERV